MGFNLAFKGLRHI